MLHIEQCQAVGTPNVLFSLFVHEIQTRCGLPAHMSMSVPMVMPLPQDAVAMLDS